MRDLGFSFLFFHPPHDPPFSSTPSVAAPAPTITSTFNHQESNALPLWRTPLLLSSHWPRLGYTYRVSPRNTDFILCSDILSWQLGALVPRKTGKWALGDISGFCHIVKHKVSLAKFSHEVKTMAWSIHVALGQIWVLAPNRPFGFSFSWYRQDTVESLVFLTCWIILLSFTYIQWKYSPVQKYERKIPPKKNPKSQTLIFYPKSLFLGIYFYSVTIYFKS